MWHFFWFPVWTLDQLQIFWHLYLIELLGLLTGLELSELWHLINPRLLTGFGMLVFFKNLSLREFQVRYLALFPLISVTDAFEWFWMGSLHKNIQLMLEFLKGPFLVLHFSYYTLMTFLMMLSVILLSMLMILFSTLSVIRQQLELASELEFDLSRCWGWLSLLNWHESRNWGFVIRESQINFLIPWTKNSKNF